MAKHDKVCPQCGREFISSRSDARFCSAICRTRHNQGRETVMLQGGGKGDDPGDKLSQIDDGIKSSDQVGGGQVARAEDQGERMIRLMEEIKQSLFEVRDILLRDNQAFLNVSDKVLTIEQVLRDYDMSRPTFERLQAEGAIRVHRFGENKEVDQKKGRGRKPYLLQSELIQALRSGGKGVIDSPSRQ